MQGPTMARSNTTYSFDEFRHKIFQMCQGLPSDKLSRVCTMVSMWEPEKVIQTTDGFECELLDLEKSTLHRISVLLGVHKLQEGAQHPMTHVQPSPLASPSRLLPFLPMPPPLSPLPQSPPRVASPRQPSLSAATGALRFVLRRINGCRFECISKDPTMAQSNSTNDHPTKKTKASKKRKAAADDENSKENKRPRT